MVFSDKGVSGALNMTHHKYINAEDLAKVENLDMSSTRCVPVTQLLLTSLYVMSPIQPFSGVSMLSGEFCLCQTDLCNLPGRQDRNKVTSDATIILPYMLILIVGFTTGQLHWYMSLS